MTERSLQHHTLSARHVLGEAPHKNKEMEEMLYKIKA